MTEIRLFEANPRWPEILKDRRIYPFSTSIPVRWQDIDTYQHVNNVAMGAMFEDARVQFSMSLNENEFAEAYMPVNVAQQIQFLAESFYGVPLNFHVGVGYIGSRSWRLWAAMFQEERCVGLGETTLALARMPPGETAMPQEFRNRLMSGRLMLESAA